MNTRTWQKSWKLSYFLQWTQIWLTLISERLRALGLSISFLRNDRKNLNEINFSQMRRKFSEYKKFPMFSTPEALLDAAANNLPVILIASMASLQEAGFMMLALRITGVPVALLGRNISSVYLSEAPAQQRQGQLGPFTRRVMGNLFCIAIRGGSLIAALSRIWLNCPSGVMVLSEVGR